jgi:general secretion pathway protein I
LATRTIQAGFTLIEVVVAFLLLSLVLATGFELFTTGMRRAVDLEERSQALAIAQSRLALAGVEQTLKEASGTASGQTEDGKFRWTLTIQRSEEAGPDPNQPLATPYGLYRIEAVVSWRGADEREQSLSLATLQLGSVL